MVQKERDYYEEELKRERQTTIGINKENDNLKLELNTLKLQTIKDSQLISIMQDRVSHNEKEKNREKEMLVREIESLKNEINKCKEDLYKNEKEIDTYIL